MAFDQQTRSRLQRFVSDARDVLTKEFTRQLQNEYGLDPVSGAVTPIENLGHLDDARRETARILRDTLTHYLATSPSGSTQEALERIAREQAFTVLNRFAALRMAEAREILIESLAEGYNSKGFQLYARLAGTGLGERGDAYRCYLFSIFDEFALDLKVLFDRFSPYGRLFPRENALLELLGLMNDPEIAPLWTEDETIGWIYQYFNSKDERKKMREASSAPRNSRELAVRNQFFTPRYVVEFLTDNTLGRIWYEMTRGETRLKDQCRYLVRRPNEIFLAPSESPPDQVEDSDQNISQEELLKQPVSIPHRPMKDPREIRVLDPACGSMHFGLYAFDLLETIYEEAWDLECGDLSPLSVRGRDDEVATSRSTSNMLEGEEIKLRQVAALQMLREEYPDKDAFLRDVPRLIVEHNLHGIDIDPRAVQIAGLSLWLRAQRAWQRMGIKSADRPQIRRSNIVCAEPMPGEEVLLQEFIDRHFAATPELRLIGQLVRRVFEEMKLAGEAGSLLKIEEEIADAVAEAKEKWLETPKFEQSRLFAEMAKPEQQRLGFDVSEITDERFWERAEEQIYSALRAYAEHAENGGGYQRRLFAGDAARGFAFIDICRKRYDVVLMNPPFGDAPEEVSVYLKNIYGFGRPDLYMCFFFRCGTSLLESDGLMGEISSRTFHTLEFFEPLRRELLLGQSKLNLLIDLGTGVLDGATVETSAYVIKRLWNGPVLAIDLSSVSEKGNVLLDQLTSLLTQQTSTWIWCRRYRWFARLPNGALTYWLPPSIERALHYLPQLDPEFASQSLLKDQQQQKGYAKVRQGLIPGSLFRFARLEWEVLPNAIGRHATWVPMMKGGEFSRYYARDPWLFLWKDNGYEAKAFAADRYGTASRTIKNEAEFFQSGLTYPRVSSVALNVRIMSTDSVFSDTGMAIIPNSQSWLWTILGLCNSQFADIVCQALHPGRKFEIAHLAALPIDESLLENAHLASLAKEAYSLMRSLSEKGELTKSVILKIKETGSVHKGIGDAIAVVKDIWLSLSKIQNEIDAIVFDAYGVLPDERDFFKKIIEGRRGKVLGPLIIEAVLRPNRIQVENIDVSGLEAEIAFLIIDNVFGRVLGQSRNGIIELSRIDEIIHSKESWRFAGQYALEGLSDKVDEGIEEQLARMLGLQDIYNYICSPKGFFTKHLEIYSTSPRQAPIYWPLSTASGSYTLWLYYHRLTDQTLYTCVNNFIEPKLSAVRDTLNQLRAKAGRSRDEEKEFERLQDFELELQQFRDELLRLARLPWHPNLNDGVQITAAPLWKLFRLSKWQKTLKDTWQKLEKGEYDWAHLAYTLWPERVREKCKKDKSLAIAHGLEELYEEPPAPAKKKRARKGSRKS